MRVRHLLVATVAVATVACRPDLTITATSPDAEPAPIVQEVHAPTLTAEQVQFLAAVAWHAAEGKAFLERVAAARAAVPPTLRSIRWCEAGSYLGLPRPDTNYGARTHGEDGASGGYQIVRSTWETWAAEVGVDVTRWPRAYLAPDFVQDHVATHGYLTRGSGPWRASAPCWS